MLHITWIQRAHAAALTAIVYLLIGCNQPPSSSARGVAALAVDALRGPEGPPGPAGEAGPTGPIGPAGKDGAPGKDGAAADTVNRSGTRLKARYLATADGARQLVGFRDLDLGERCTFTPGSDEYAPGEGNVLRCYPTDAQRLAWTTCPILKRSTPNGWTYFPAFADAACTSPVALTSKWCGSQPYSGQPYAVRRSSPTLSDADWPIATVTGVFAVEPFEGPLYRWSDANDGTCVPVEDDGELVVEPGPYLAYTPVTPDTFVAATEEE